VAYKNGSGVEKDEREAVRWFRAAATLDLPLAHCNLGVCCENGEGIEKSIVAAACFYQIAIENGDEEAVTNLRDLKLSEVGPKKKNAVKMLKDTATTRGDIIGSEQYRFVSVPKRKSSC
jgi:TPR repeat protein